MSGGLSIVGDITGSSGQFDGDLGASGGNFRVRSGDVTALSGTIGGWVINEQAFKSSAVAFPAIELDPVSPKFEIRQSAHASSESGIKVIKIDPTSGIRAGTTSNFKFTVDMDGNMSATDAVFNSGSFTGNITSSATISGGTIQTSGTVGAYTGNTLTISGGAVSADKVIRLTALNASSNGVINLLADYLEINAATEITGPIELSGSTLFNGENNQINRNTEIGGISTKNIRNIWIRNTLVATNSSDGYIGDVWLQYS